MNKLTISTTIEERDLVEHCLNLHYSGYDWKPILLFYALGHLWNIDKLLYYKSLMKEEK